MATQDMTTAAPTATAEMPRPIAVAMKYIVSPSPVHVEMREEPERAAGGASSLRLRCTLTSSYEQHTIGEPEPDVADEEGPTLYESSLDDVDLRSDDACRAAVLKLLSVIAAQIEGPVSLLDPAAGEWYEPVLRDTVGQLRQLVTPSGEEETCGGYALDASLSIEEIHRYVQHEALMLACEQAAAAAIPASQLAPDARCVVCMERLLAVPSPDDARPAVCTEDENKAFTLPACRHTFHRRCVATWFEEGSTCPLCRCDMKYCLYGIEKQFGIR